MKGIGLCLATIGLYGGGVVFNDVFDAGLDAVERDLNSRYPPA